MRSKTIKRLSKIVKDNYQEISDKFDASRKKMFWPELQKIADDIKDGDSILDLGCGNGRLLEALKNKKITYLGLDSSEELIALARINYPEHKFLVADMIDLKSVLTEKYDYIISAAVIHHLPSQSLRKKVVREITDYLKEDGVFIFSVWRLWNKKKYRSQLIRGIFRKVFFLDDLDFGDLLFFWKDKNGKNISQRYYHAFTKRELRKTAPGFKIWRDHYNYWASFRNKQ